VILVSTSIDRGTDSSKQATTAPRVARSQDCDSREWLRPLREGGEAGNAAIARLHALLLRAARYEVARRRPGLPHLRRGELDGIALEAAADALVSVLRRLDDFRGDSRFSTWVYKFALLETAVKLRERAWQGRELPVEPNEWNLFANLELEPDVQVEQRELLSGLHTAIEALTPHQRRVLVAVAVNGVPMDVLAERLQTSRGALYKTLHDARQNLRRHLGERGLTIA
jgi:RNA polymerase sigma-70 factor (ECF subfamily)